VQAARTAIQNTSHHVLFVFRDLVNYNQQLANLIFDEYYKYEPVLNEALTQFMREQEKEVINEDQRPEESRENYECSWDDGYSDGIDQSVRGLKCNSLGKLIRLRGTVTRTS
jgi:DNA replicative helicase MCM subunit Mcm2 (Cdc46/Mcm family)